MPVRRWRALLAAAAVAFAAPGLMAQHLSASVRSNLESAFLLPVLDPARRQLLEDGLAVWCSPGSRYHFAAQRLVAERGLFLHYGGAEPPPWPRFKLPRTVTRGGPVRVAVASAAPLAGLSVTVELPDGERVEGRGFAVAADSSGDWAALLGIPTTAATGAARLSLTGHAAAGVEPAFRLLLVQPLTVAARTFAEEEIPLRAQLATLRRAPDPRRREQSRELWRLLTSWRADAYRHLGPLRLPLDEIRRTAGFGDRRTYRYEDGKVDVSIHNGIDFGAPEGTAVVASGSGTVMMARARIVTGLSVAIEHLPGVYSLYYHLARILVREGQHVAAGAVLGTVGSTGLATGPHLHWELRSGGVAVDPDMVVDVPLVDTAGDRVIIVR